MSSVSPTELANLIEERVVRVGLILWPNCVEVIIDNNGRLCRLTDILQLSHTDYRILYDKIFVLTLSFLKERYSTRRKPLHSTTIVIDYKLWNR